MSYCYGFPAELGGGPYSRSANLPPLDPTQFQFARIVGAGKTLADAVAAWNTWPPGSTGIIILPDYESDAIDLTGAAAIRMPSQSQLWIIAAQVHQSLKPFDVSYSESRVTLRGDIEIRGEEVIATGAENVAPDGQLKRNGLWITGGFAPSGMLYRCSSDCPRAGLALKRDEPFSRRRHRRQRRHDFSLTLHLGPIAIAPTAAHVSLQRCDARVAVSPTPEPISRPKVRNFTSRTAQ